MKVNFENCEVDVAELKRGAVVMKYYDDCEQPALYHISYFVGLRYNSNIVRLCVDDSEESYNYDSSELVWPNP